MLFIALLDDSNMIIRTGSCETPPLGGYGQINPVQSGSFHFFIADMHIHAIDTNIPQMLVCFTASEIIVFAAFHMFKSLIGEKSVALPASRLRYAIFQEAVNQIDIRT